MKIGDSIRVTARGQFLDWAGVIVAAPRRRDSRAWGIQFPGHPWQDKLPTAVWWFTEDEIDLVVS